MTIGYCTVQFLLPENGSLKGKRQFLRSVTQRVKNKFNVSIAEVENQDSWRYVYLGIAHVSTSAAHNHEVLEKIVDFMQEERLDAELLGYQIENIDA